MKTFREYFESKESVVLEDARLIDTIKLGNNTAKIYKNDDEFIVKFFKDGKHIGEKSDYYADDKEDATNRANHMLKDLKK